MKKTLKKTDFLFIIMVSAVLLVHLYFLFVVPFSDDESHYVTVPFRLINGESLVQHEWHLTQFASLFSYLPVRIWLAIKGSADGIFIFTRCIYLAIHTSVAVVIYRFFREYGKWAILASMMFYAQLSYRIMAISYQSMFVVFLLLFTLCLLSIYKKKSTKNYILAGVCFGCCCVCNPFFCVAFVLYLICCALWTKREAIREYITKNKSSKKDKKLTKRQKREQKKQLLENAPEYEKYNCFFNKEAILKVTCGVLIIAIIAVAFFLSTGGTVGSIFDNLENLLGSSEYDIVSKSGFSKLLQTLGFFSMANLNLPLILPLIFVALLLDKKRKENSHRFAYLVALIVWTVVFIIGVIVNLEIYVCGISFPFSAISLACYILTEKKNKVLFNCMYMPCLVASFFHYLAADTHLGAIGVVMAVGNVAGVIFARDLWMEMKIPLTDDTEKTVKKKAPIQGIIIVAFCLQITFYGIFYQYGQIYGADTPKATSGPYAGLYMTEIQYERYNNAISDLDVIRTIADEDDPVLIDSYNNWMYLYLDRPFAIYTTWYRGILDVKQLTAYYKENPEKIPEYIYVESPNLNRAKIENSKDLLDDLFEFSEEMELSNGVLLTVKRDKI